MSWAQQSMVATLHVDPVVTTVLQSQTSLICKIRCQKVETELDCLQATGVIELVKYPAGQHLVTKHDS